MLSRQQHEKKSKKDNICNCALLRSTSIHHQEGNIIISHHKEIQYLSNIQANSYLFRQKCSFMKPKLSLRGSRIQKEKENTAGYATPQDCPVKQNMNQTLHRAIANLKSGLASLEQSANTKKKARTTSIFCNIVDPEIEKTAFYRTYYQEEHISQNQETKKRISSSSKGKVMPSVQIDSNTRNLNLSKQIKQPYSTQEQEEYNIEKTNFHTEKEISGKNSDYISQQALLSQKENLMQEYSQQPSTVVLKKKKTRILHYIQKMQFKSTESINQSQSVQVSEVITNLDSIDSNQNKSQQEMPQFKRLSQLLKPKLSRVTQAYTQGCDQGFINQRFMHLD